MDSYDVPTGRIVDWVRHNGIEKLAIKSDERRPFLYGSPILPQDMSKLLDYECSNELGISVTLSCRIFRMLYYVETLAKQSFWFIKHLCERTDVIEEKVPIRFCITTDVREMVSPYLRACNFPEDKIDWIESQEAVFPQSTKMLAMKHVSFKDVQRVLHLDTTLFISTEESQYKGTWFKNVKDTWKSEPFAQSHMFIVPDKPEYRKFHEARGMSIFDRYWGGGIPPEEHLLWTTLSEFLNESPVKLKECFLKDSGDIIVIIGPCFGFSQSELYKITLDRDIYPVMRVSGDEAAIAAYAYREGWTNDDVCDMSLAFNWIQFSDLFKPKTEYGLTFSDQRIPAELWMRQYE